jgi:hypothetical protein
LGNISILNDLWAFNATTLSWQAVANENAPPARFGASMVQVGSNLFLFGGLLAFGSHVKSSINDWKELSGWM